MYVYVMCVLLYFDVRGWLRRRRVCGAVRAVGSRRYVASAVYTVLHTEVGVEGLLYAARLASEVRRNRLRSETLLFCLAVLLRSCLDFCHPNFFVEMAR